jgi:hypothetical protein
MFKNFQTGALVAALISTVAGHTSVEKFEAGGKTYEGFRQASKQDPGNKSPAWWTNQGWGYQPIYGDKLSQYVYTNLSFTFLLHVLTELQPRHHCPQGRLSLTVHRRSTSRLRCNLPLAPRG